ncbi:formin-J isoform X2 [Episyrphus balteatus]|uniref:formin-J isoform X2 n=1 Tax=Episyrphus balteatus TaxID=286459 RepID=UPI0024861070|nr:formin-J isoform X2 [Episyrphus balteatus]
MTLPRMDSRIGLDYIVENREYVSKLGAALDTNNTTVKKQVFELLSALCAYNSEGYSRAIETLEFYKNLKNERYRFKIVINELENATNIEYQVALLAFINCVIISAANLQDRVRIRNEFIGLKVLPLLNNLRKVAQSVGDIIVQLDVFDEQRECDEAQSLQGPNGINLNSHLDVFSAILGQVADTPQEIPFLSILQHLLRIEPKEAVSDIIWDTTEKLVHRATLLENHEDSVRLLRSPSVQKFTCPHCRGEATSPSRKQSSAPLMPSSFQVTPPPPAAAATTHSLSNSPLSPTTGRGGGGPPPVAAPPPPPPPPIPAFGGGGGGNGVPPPPPPPGCSRIPGPPVPPPPASNLLSNNSADNRLRSTTPDMGFNETSVLLPQQETPAPKAKMKTINWNKIPQNKVIGKQNIWATVSFNHQLDWTKLEGLFCLQSTSAQGSPKLGRDSGTDTLDRKSKKENSEITLLDGKRSLNVNIFLKQFRTSNEDIIELIRNGEHNAIGAEKLRGLLKILPEFDELDMLKSYNGDKNRLGNAEKFILQLLEVPNYKLRIESMLLKEEFAANVTYLDPYINAMIFAGDDLMNNKMLQEVLYMVVLAGNFLNSGGYAGNAAGVKLSSLQKLTDIRANKPGINLMHFVAMEMEKQNPELLNFPDQLTMLENASKTTSDQINYEINALDVRIKKIKRQVELPTTDIDIKEQMTEFLRNAENEVTILQRGMKEVDCVRLKLAEYFCEDPASFKLEECFKIFQNLADKFKQAVKENERRQQQEEQATLRRKQREEQLARRARQLSQCGTPVSDPENPLLLDPSFDPRSSPAFSRRRMGSFNTGIDCNSWREDGISPDITPNGSLRRRRSRVLEEDDDLMKFLRASGQDNGSRERKASAYGSLDRSWARKARSGSASRKRPELLNIDFGADRERANSPSPMAETKPPPAATAASDDNKPRISREWRQKIESWLQSNENDEKQNEEYKRKRRLVSNGRRSLENDSESERNKLDPLPEEKISVNANGVETYKRDWKPSKALEKTDIAGTIQAIEDVNNTRDKSSWRKSNLNVSNSSEEVITREDTSTRTKPSINTEQEDRKSLIHILGELPASDRLQIYVRRPSDINDIESKCKAPTPNSSDPKQLPPLILDIKNDPSIYKNQSPIESPAINRFITIRDRHDDKYSRKEIDSDNIETPPVVRRATQNSSLRRPLYAPTVVTLNSPTTECDGGKISPGVDHLVDNEPIGHFDRFSAARRTRRYKRPTDYSSGTEDISPPTIDSPSKDTNKNQSIPNEIETKLKLDDLQIKKPIICEKTVAKLEKVGRHISSINQEDVREAIRNLKSPTGEPERIWSPPREIISNEKPAPTTTVIKVSANSHELNDEGFEETQSLVSDTPSHGKESTSSCNDVNEAVTKQSSSSTTTRSQGRTNNKEPVTIANSISSHNPSREPAVSKTKTNPQKNQIHNILERNKRSMDRARLLRANPTTTSSSNTLTLPSNLTPAASAAMRRANSLRKSDSASNSKKDVERSSSRTSLRSSRSSLNSGTSTNTVRRMPVKPLLTNSVESSPSKRPLSAANSSRNQQRISASRSSSSGSSIGATIRKPSSTTTTRASSSNLGGSNSFRDSNHQSGSSRVSSTPRSAVLVKASVTNVSSSTPTLINRQRSPTRPASAASRLSGFMRPTASSATKRLQGDNRGK